MVRKHDNRLIVLMAPVRYTPDADARGAGIVLVQLRADGRLDRTFGHNGVAHLTRSGIGPNALALRRDGKIVVVGYSARKPPNRGLLLARYLPSGRLDPTFGDDGLRTASLGLWGVSINSLIAAPTGDLIVAGSGARHQGEADDFLVADFRSNGALRTSFGDGGVALIGLTIEFDGANALVRQPDGKIVAAGTMVHGDPTIATRPALVRLLPNGQPDPTFGISGGRVMPLPVTSGDNGINDLVRQPDGRLVAGGGASIYERSSTGPPVVNKAADSRFMLLRFQDR